MKLFLIFENQESQTPVAKKFRWFFFCFGIIINKRWKWFFVFSCVNNIHHQIERALSRWPLYRPSWVRGHCQGPFCFWSRSPLLKMPKKIIKNLIEKIPRKLACYTFERAHRDSIQFRSLDSGQIWLLPFAWNLSPGVKWPGFNWLFMWPISRKSKIESPEEHEFTSQWLFFQNWKSASKDSRFAWLARR